MSSSLGGQRKKHNHDMENREKLKAKKLTRISSPNP
jgi:hypothetical protein